MKLLRTALQIPVLVLILYLGAVNLYSVISFVQTTPHFGFDWHFPVYVAEGILEVALLIWIYRLLGEPTRHDDSHPLNQGKL